MSVDISFGESAASVRAKAIQDREQIRARLAKIEQEVVSLRQLERKKTEFIDTLDGYIESHVQVLKTVESALFEGVSCKSLHQHYFPAPATKSDFKTGAVSAAMNAVMFGLKPACMSVSASAAAAAAVDGTSQSRSASAQAVDDYTKMFDEPAASTIKKVARPGTNMRAVTDEAYVYLDVMDHYASTEKLADFIRSKPHIYALLGTRPASTLSSYLSRDPRFDYQRPRGWTLDQGYVEDFADQGGVVVSGLNLGGGV